MFNKVDFSDINKFIVSLGLILIIISLVVPRYFIADILTHKISQAEYDALTQGSKYIVLQKEQIIRRLMVATPIVSAAMFVVGSICIVFGLRRWNKKQTDITDAIDRATLQKLQLEIKPQSQEEKIKSILIDTDTIKLFDNDSFNADNLTRVTPPQEQSKDTEKNDTATLAEKVAIHGLSPFAPQVLDALEVERIVMEKIEAKNPFEYEIQTNIKISDYPLDILMQSKVPSKNDRAFEVKYFPTSVNYQSLYSSIDRLANFVHYYNDTYKKKVAPLLIVVYQDGILSDQDAIRLDSTLREYIGKKQVYVRVYSKSRLKQSTLSDVIG